MARRVEIRVWLEHDSPPCTPFLSFHTARVTLGPSWPSCSEPIFGLLALHEPTLDRLSLQPHPAASCPASGVKSSSTWSMARTSVGGRSTCGLAAPLPRRSMARTCNALRSGGSEFSSRSRAAIKSPGLPQLLERALQGGRQARPAAQRGHAGAHQRRGAEVAVFPFEPRQQPGVHDLPEPDAPTTTKCGRPFPANR
jgi:hypothetical protein